MSGWPETALSEVLADATPGFACGEDVEDGVFQFRMNNITTEGQLDLSKRRRVPRNYRKIDRFVVQPGDVLFNATNSPDLVGKTAYFPGLNEPAVFSNHFLRLRPHDSEIDGRYLARWLNLQFLHGRFRAMCRQWVNQATVGRDALLSLRVPLPLLPEQRRIAEILDKADALRAKRRAALTQLDTLTQSIFLDMFGDPATNPKGWPVKRVDEITQCLDRLRRPVTESDRKPGNVPYYGANGQQGWIDTALFDEPLVLVAEDGGYFDAPERGVAYRIDGPAWVNNHAHILRVLPQHVDTEFLHRALRHFNFLPYISGTTRAKLTQGQLNSVKLFVPSLQLQRDFGQRVAGVLRIAGVTARSGEHLNALFTSLQCRAFRGDLLPSAVGQPAV
jgi:type I restriction enzyme S subunit